MNADKRRWEKGDAISRQRFGIKIVKLLTDIRVHLCLSVDELSSANV